MRFKDLRVVPLLFAIIATLCAAGPDKSDSGHFEVRAADAYPHHQTSEKVTVAAEVFETDAQAHTAFGKLNPWRYGVLPVLIVIRNDSADALRVDRMKFVYVLPDRSRLDAVPAQDVKYINGAKQPKLAPGPIGGIHLGKTPTNPLAEWGIEGRAFAAKMIPAGQTASGFVYFQPQQISAAASVYVSGLEDPVTGRELYYFEIPMSGR